MSKTLLPSIPAVPADASSPKTFLSAVKEIIEVWKGDRGDLLDSVVTFRALLGDSGTVLGTDPFTGFPIIESIGSGGGSTYNTYVTNNTTISPPVDPAVPPDIAGLTTAGIFTDIILTWTPVSYSNHAYTEIWRFTSDTTASKTLIGTTRANIYVDSTGEGQTYFYWARNVSTSDILGNFVLHGVSGTTQTTLNASYLTDASIGTAKIANLAVSDAKIASLTAAKITAGTLVAGESITVGTGGNRIIIDSYGNIRTGSVSAYASGSGFWMGENAGSASFFFGNSAAEYVSYNGTNLRIQTPEFTLNAGAATFSGTLTAPTINGGTINGTIFNVGTTGHIKGGATAYNTGIGYFLGYDTVGISAHKFFIGDPGGMFLRWTGNNLEYNGLSRVGGVAIYTTAGTYSTPGTYADMVAGLAAFVVPVGVTNLYVAECIGGGAGGGGGNYTNGFCGGAGGAGQVKLWVPILFVTPGAVISITVGAAGVGGASGTNTGTDGTSGGSSTVGGYVTSAGGGYGQGVALNLGAEPQGASGDLTTSEGRDAVAGRQSLFQTTSGSGHILARGPKSVIDENGAHTTPFPTDAQAAGCGGGGGGLDGATLFRGGNGKPGKVVIIW